MFMSKKTVGIIGGMGPDATVDLFQKIIRATPAEKDQDHLRILIDNNPDIPDRTRAILYSGESPVPALTATAKNLQQGGADFLVMPCNTAHYYHHLLSQIVSIPVLHMMAETARFIGEEYPEIKIVGLLATDGTLQSRLYHRYLEDAGLSVKVPDGVHQRILMEAIYGTDGIKAGQRMAPAVRVQRVATHLIEAGCEVLIAGCTEIPLVLSDGDCAVPVVDATWILAKATVRTALAIAEAERDRGKQG
jgi:aspartate racemase